MLGKPEELGGSTASTTAPLAERRRLAALGALLVAFAVAYGSVVASLVGAWWSNTMYSYGLLIPFISAYLVWVDRAALLSVETRAAPLLGGAVLLGGLGMLVVGSAGAIISLQQLSLLASLAGTIILVWGTRMLKAVRLPIAYLLFMVPVWEVVTDRLHFPFQMVSAKLGVFLLHMVGVPAYRQGVFIELPRVTLEIAEVCSGVNYLLAVLALGIPLAHLSVEGWRRQVLLVVGAVAIAAFSNGLRVAVIGVLAYAGFDGDIHGPFHVLQGLFVSAIGYVALFVGAGMLSGGRIRGRVAQRAEESSRVGQPGGWASGSLRAMLAAGGLLAVAGSFAAFWQPAARPLVRDLETFPYRVNEWQGRSIPMDRGLPGSVAGEYVLSRRYASPTGDEVDLYVGYFASQTQGRELAGDRFRTLSRDAGRARLDLGATAPLEVGTLIRREGAVEKHVVFWYDLNGVALANGYEVKLGTAWSALTRGRTDGAIVVVTTALPAGGARDEVPASTAQFLVAGLPILTEFLAGR